MGLFTNLFKKSIPTKTKYTDAQILAMLKEKVDIDPSDDAMVVAVKNTVQNFKVDALRVIDSGSPVFDVLDGMVRRKTEDGLLRAQALQFQSENDATAKYVQHLH